MTRTPPQAPPVFTATPESLLADTHRIIETSKAIEDSIVINIAPESATFANVCLPGAQDSNEFALESQIICFYQSVSSDQKLRDASVDAEKLMDDYSIESLMREDIFKLVDAVSKKSEFLDPESQRMLEKRHKNYIKSGLSVPAGPKRDRFEEIKKRLSKLSLTFQKTLNEENGGIWFTIEELDGVPKDIVDNLKHGEDGKVWLTFKDPDLYPALRYAKAEATRRKVWIDDENKCNSSVPLFREIIILRDEAARILGYNNHAEYRIEDTMAKDPAIVNEFLGDLQKRLIPGGVVEIQKLLALKEDDLKIRNLNTDGRYYLWDHIFYNRLMLEKHYSFDQEKTAEYFPLDSTIQGMLHIFEEIFGLEFIKLDKVDREALSPTGKGDDIIWHQDVQVFSVWDDEGEGGEFVGYLYLDLFPRDAKYGQDANFNLQPGFIDRNGKRRYPATALVCNFTKPTAKKPSLLKHDEVLTLFHELGHGIHNLVSKTIYSTFHGTSTVDDFLEAPSQMLENWCWIPSQLRSLSKHWSYLSPEYAADWAEMSSEKAPEPIPNDLIDSIIRTKHVNSALYKLHQLHFAIFDMTIHTPSTHDDVQKLPISETFNKLRSEIRKANGPETQGASWDWSHGHTTFDHLVTGYDAVYYGYLFSQVYSTDMFNSVFKADPMNKEAGRRYRYMVLEKGGSQDEMKTLEEFLGRKPSTKAFYEELGIA